MCIKPNFNRGDVNFNFDGYASGGITGGDSVIDRCGVIGKALIMCPHASGYAPKPLNNKVNVKRLVKTFS